MKETKVYVDELPENCKKCVYSQINLAFGVETRICNLQYGFISANNDKFPNCPLQSLKDHDRKLVKEVCKKIEKAVCDNVLYMWTPDKEDNYTIFNIDKVLEEIQKEFKE